MRFHSGLRSDTYAHANHYANQNGNAIQNQGVGKREREMERGLC